VAAAGEGGAPAGSYYQAVEEFFVSRRGDPLFLASADWILVHRWHSQGLPLRVVLRGIADALDSHAHSWSRGRKVGSLRYCAAEVDAACQRWRRALGFGEGVGVAAALRGFADAVEAARGLEPAAAAVAGEVAAALRAQAAQPEPQAWDAEGELEPWLRAQEARLVEALAGQAGPELLGRVEAEVEALMAPYRGRMPAPVLRRVGEDGRARRLLEAHGLPRLSLALVGEGVA